jgi:hypothetical protein
MEEETINNDLHTPMKKIRINEVKNAIQYKINQKKAPVYDLITGKILKEVSPKRSQSSNTNLQCHTTNRIFPLSVESGTNHNYCKNQERTQMT